MQRKESYLGVLIGKSSEYVEPIDDLPHVLRETTQLSPFDSQLTVFLKNTPEHLYRSIRYEILQVSAARGCLKPAKKG